MADCELCGHKDKNCGAKYRGLFCTRYSGHPGAHAACGAITHPMESWTRGGEPTALEKDLAAHGISPLKDSGARRDFPTGAVRDASGPEKGAPHLRPVHALNALDRHMAKGAAKYEARNWEKGIPLSVYFDSAQRHADKLLAGYDDEDHAAAWMWNVACFIETRERVKRGLLPAELDDIPDTFKGLEPEF